MQQAAKLQIENFGLSPFSFCLFLSSVHQWFFYVLAIYMFLRICSYVLFVKNDVRNKVRREQGETNWRGTGRGTYMVPSHNTLGPPSTHGGNKGQILRAIPTHIYFAGTYSYLPIPVLVPHTDTNT